MAGRGGHSGGDAAQSDPESRVIHGTPRRPGQLAGRVERSEIIAVRTGLEGYCFAPPIPRAQSSAFPRRAPTWGTAHSLRPRRRAGTGAGTAGVRLLRLAKPLPHLQARQQADITWCAADALLGDAGCLAGGRKFGPLACQGLSRPVLVVHAGLHRLINGKTSRRGHVQFAAPIDIECRHPVSHGDDELRTQGDHGN